MPERPDITNEEANADIVAHERLEKAFKKWLKDGDNGLLDEMDRVCGTNTRALVAAAIKSGAIPDLKTAHERTVLDAWTYRKED